MKVTDKMLQAAKQVLDNEVTAKSRMPDETIRKMIEAAMDAQTKEFYASIHGTDFEAVNMSIILDSVDGVDKSAT